MKYVALAAILALSFSLGGCADKTEYTEVSYDVMFHNQEEASSKDVKTKVEITHLVHDEWTTMIMSCRPKGGCYPIFIHHERDDWKICDPEGSECFKWSSSTWNHPVINGPGYVYGHIKWQDCKTWWWNTCDNPGYRTKVRGLTAA